MGEGHSHRFLIGKGFRQTPPFTAQRDPLLVEWPGIDRSPCWIILYPRHGQRRFATVRRNTREQFPRLKAKAEGERKCVPGTEQVTVASHHLRCRIRRVSGIVAQACKYLLLK